MARHIVQDVIAVLPSFTLRELRRGRKRGPLVKPAFLDVFLNRLRGMKVDADGAALVAFFVQANRSFVSILMKVRDLQAAAGRQPNAGSQAPSSAAFTRAAARRRTSRWWRSLKC